MRARPAAVAHLFLAAALALPASMMAFPAQGSRQQGPPQEKASAPTDQGNKDQSPDMPLALPKGKKLILRDGSFHVVREYERRSERVRYYSVERSAWEEIPAELVDWEATRKNEAAEAERAQESAEKVRALRAAERAADLDVGASIEVAPGIFLPENEGVFVVEGRTVSPLSQAAAEAKLDKGRLAEQILVPIPVVPSRRKVQVAGKRAEMRLTTAQPEFYMRTADAREPEMELVRAEVKGDKRQIELISTNIVGQHSEKRNAISIQRWNVARGVFRFTLSQPLDPGEYALTEILPEGMNLYVWDFGVDGSASRPGSPPSRQAQPKPKQ